MRSTVRFITLTVLVLIASSSFAAAPHGPAANYFRAPLRFEPNVGQSAPQTNFVSHGMGYVVHLSAAEAVFSMPHERLSMSLVGANRAASPTAEELLDTKANYFVGSDPSRWHVNIPTYRRARYRNVYEGIDVVYYGAGDQLEYDFVVAPGADAKQIALHFPEAGKLSIDRGDLLVAGEYGVLRFHQPYVYQEFGGSRREVEARYRISNGNVLFAVGNYDHGHALIIDPTLVFSTYLGGTNGLDFVTAIAADASSNSYATGVTNSTNFPTTNHGTLSAPSDTFVTKLDTKGAIKFSTYFGGNSGDEGNAIALDSLGNIYFAGRTDSTNLPTTAGTVGFTKPGGSDGFVAKLSPAGVLVYCTYIGGSGSDAVTGLALDSLSNVYLTGSTDSTNFPGAGLPSGFEDAFVMKLGAGATSLAYSQLIGGPGSDGGNAVAVDAAGNAYVTGFVTNSAMTDKDIFIAALSPLGAPVYPAATACTGSNPSNDYANIIQCGGTFDDSGTAIAVDVSGNVWVGGLAGGFREDSGGFPITGNALQGYGGGNSDAVIISVNPAGTVTYSTFLGGSSNDSAFGIGADPQGTISIGGSTSSGGSNAQYPNCGGLFEPDANTHYRFPTVNPIQECLKGTQDGFVARLNPFSNPPSLVYSTYLGGTGDDQASALAVAPTTDPTKNNTFLGGFTSSIDFPSSRNVKPGSGQSGFVAMLSDGAVPPPPPPPGSETPFILDCTKVDIEKPKAHPTDDTFHLECQFTLAAGASISPATEGATLSIDTFSVTIPSFKQEGNPREAHFKFEGKVDGVQLKEDLRSKGGLTYQFTAEGKHANLSNSTSPVTIKLKIGDDSGTTIEAAKIR